MIVEADTLYLRLAEPGHKSGPPGRTDETRAVETTDRDAVLAAQLLASGLGSTGSK